MWNYYEWFAVSGLVSIISGTIFTFFDFSGKGKYLKDILLLTGISLIGLFIALHWIELERPPMRTLGETRLWYAFFVILIGYILYIRFNLKLFLIYCAMMATVFLGLNYFIPEVQSKTLMPALQSPWFIPHVVVYLVSYALLGLSALMGVIGYRKLFKGEDVKKEILLADKIVLSGFGFLTLGLVFGALWAKEAWGNFWTWDPKESWALLSWLLYLIYIHFRKNKPEKYDLHFLILFIGFIVVLLCWFGIKYLPTAANSVHIYS
jgi:ABC-type transport system involved in cytochrome c biogenesis permease subunit